MWKLLYPDSNGSNQSPINIATQLVVVVQPSEPLRWNGYDKGPLSTTIANNENNGANFPLVQVTSFSFFFFFFYQLWLECLQERFVVKSFLLYRSYVVYILHFKFLKDHLGRLSTGHNLSSAEHFNNHRSISSDSEHNVGQLESTVYRGWLFD